MTPCLRIAATGILAQATEIIRHGIMISRGNRQRIAAANLPGGDVILLPAQPQLELIHAGEHLIVQLLEHGRISREAAGIQALHLADQFLQISQRRRLALEALTKLVQLAHRFLVGALNFFRRRWNRLRFVSRRPSTTVTATIPRAIDRTVAAGQSSAARAADWASVGSTGRRARRTGTAAGLTVGLLPGLTRLTGLAGLAVSAELAGLILLTGLALTLLTGLPSLLAVAVRCIAHAAREGLHLIAKPLDLVEGFLRIYLLAIEGLLRLMQGIVEPLHAVGDALILPILGRIDSAANPIRALPEPVLQITLFHAAKPFAQFPRGIRLASAKPSRRFLHLLFEPAERVRGLLAIVAELGLLFALVQAIRGSSQTH